jgi:hypothetical protein
MDDRGCDFSKFLMSGKMKKRPPLISKQIVSFWCLMFDLIIFWSLFILKLLVLRWGW